MDYELARALAEQEANEQADLMYPRPCEDRTRTYERMVREIYHQLTCP